MKVYDAASIRNVALVGHSGSGKTQLASAILADAGMINRFGKVDDGTTVTDFDEEEVARKHTLSASVAYAEWNKQKINLIDTPGMGNFFADSRAALNIADAAIVVVDAVGGVMVQTEKMWAAAEELSMPRLVVVNRLDRDRASLERTLASLRELCNRTVIPIQLPIGEESDFRGVVDLVSKKAFIFQGDESGKFTEGAGSGRDGGRGQQRARSADRDGRGKRRTPDGEVFRGRHVDRRGAGAAACAARRWRRSCFRWSAPRRCATSASRSCSTPIVTCLPSPVDRPFKGLGADGAEVRAGRRRERRRCPRSCGRRSPIRSPAGSRCSASSPAA